MPSFRRPDSLYACLVCFSAALNQAIAVGTMLSSGVFFVAFLDRFGESRQKTAWVGSVLFFFSMNGVLLGSMLNKKMSIRALAVFGYLFAIIGYVTTAYAKSLDVIFFTFSTVTGFGISSAFLVNNMAVTRYFIKYRSIANSLVGVGISVGDMTMSPLIQYILQWTNFKTCFLSLSGLHVVPCLFSLTFDPNIEPRPGENERATKNDTSIKENYGVLFRDHVVQTFILAFILTDAAGIVTLTFMVKHCEDLGIPRQLGANLFIYYGVAGIAGRFVSGLVAQVFLLSKLHIMLYGSTYPMGIAVFVAPQIQPYEGFIVLMIILGVTRGTFMSMYNVVLYELCGPSLHPQALGMLCFATSLGLMLCPPFANFLADLHGSYDAAFYFSGSLCALSAVLFHLIDVLKKRISNKELIETYCDSTSCTLVVERETVL